ncbi:hypothetical protein EXB72_22055 [Salmonella enterica subsp. enterica serovar Durham]|nr:hypothetical protein [Salmonella enterica subsp. enterica serovar Bahati]ECG3768099.1 hypothetical protein [Salmonella enterica subsp. enterica serovar Durham]EGQ4747258.1 hypothetical protein [Salmonella enterica subsp. enterica serovar Durham]
MREQLYQLYYSGMDVCDLTPEWISENEEHFCRRCGLLKLPHSSMDFVTDGKIRKNLDMISIGHNLIPGVMSLRLFELLGESAPEHLNIGAVYNRVAGNNIRQPFVTFISKHEYIVLRGEKPDIFDGIPVPENEREVVCHECCFRARRERYPYFLLESEYPEYPICCTDVGLLIYESVYNEIKNKKLTGVRVDKIKIK